MAVGESGGEEMIQAENKKKYVGQSLTFHTSDCLSMFVDDKSLRNSGQRTTLGRRALSIAALDSGTPFGKRFYRLNLILSGLFFRKLFLAVSAKFPL